MTGQPRTPRSQRGSLSIWVVLVTAGAFTPLLGLVVDGGNLIDARLEASRDAAQAARAGADALSAASVRTGGNDVNPGIATSRARAYLADVGQRGTVTVNGATVTVTITGTSHTTILAVVGITSFPISQTQSARGITEATP
jgi:hypothetical protein